MSAPFEPNQSIHDQHLGTAVDAVLLVHGGEHLYGYAVLNGTRDEPEYQVYTFPDRESMFLALSELHNGRLLSDKYHTIYQFEPNRRLRSHGTVEWDDDQLEQALFERACREGTES